MKTEQLLIQKKELLDIFLKHRVDSPFPGDWESIYKGTGFEFWSLREWTPGDPFKDIDWKARAKTGKYFVREYLAESYYTLMILYDVSRSMAFGRKDLLQANIAVSLAYSAITGNNGCGLILFADEVLLYVPPRMGRAHFMQIVSAIAQAEPVPCSETKLNRALAKLVNDVPESLTFILSDFEYPFVSDYNFQRTLHGTNKHEVKAIQILERGEIELPAGSRGLLRLFDYESAETALIDLGKWQVYNESRKEKIAGTKQRLNQAGIEFLTLGPEDDFVFEINALMRGIH